MDDDKYDELLSKGLRTIKLEIPISEHVWLAFKRACEYSDNKGRPFPQTDADTIDAYGVHLEYAMESYIGDLAKTEELTTFFLAEALQHVWAEKDREKQAEQADHTSTKTKSAPCNDGMA